MNWTRIASGRLRADVLTRFPIRMNHRNRLFTHLKVQIFPDGGLKRVRALGYFMPTTKLATPTKELQSAVDLTNGEQENEETESLTNTPYNLRARRSNLDNGRPSRKRKRRTLVAEETGESAPVKTETPSPEQTR